MNEAIFGVQIASIIGIVKGAEKLGKEAVMVLAVLLALFANFFVLKQITLFGWTVTCSDAFVIGHLMCLNLLQQKEGKGVAQKAILLSFSAMLIFAFVSLIHLVYQTSSFDQMQGHYQALLTTTPRIFAASLFTFYCVQRLDLFLFSRILNLLPLVSWKVRSALSLLISQLFDTLLFTLLGLYGVVEDWIAIFWMSFAIKCSVIGMMTLLWREQPREV